MFMVVFCLVCCIIRCFHFVFSCIFYFLSLYSLFFFWLIVFVYVFFFFFSSRRRHTRSLCDWSSDVCSSDLPPTRRSWLVRYRPFAWLEQVGLDGIQVQARLQRILAYRIACTFLGAVRSEERRVGKEGRSRWGPYRYRTKMRIDDIVSEASHR